MAVQIHRIDDLNGDSGASPYVITINGDGIEVDLGERSRNALTAALAPFWSAGHEGTYDVEARQGRGSRRKRDDADRDYDAAAVRAWAEANGITVNPRGRVPREIIDRYNAAS